jgi:hypothetical protein
VKAVPDSSDDLSASQFIAAWAVVARDIESAGLSGRAVVTTSMGCEQTVYLNIGKSGLTTALVGSTELTLNDVLTYMQSIRDVINLDVPVVVASGTIDVSFGFLLTKQHSLTIVVAKSIENNLNNRRTVNLFNCRSSADFPHTSQRALYVLKVIFHRMLCFV